MKTRRRHSPPFAMAAIGTVLLVSGCASFRHPDDAWWGPDKARHVALSAALAAGASYALADGHHDEAAAVEGGLVLSAAAGATKELHDQRVKRTYFSGKDLAWDLLGGLLGGLLGAAAAE